MKYTKTFMASIVVVAVFSIAVVPIAQKAIAEPEFVPWEPNWGKATAWYAQNVGMGEHSSDQSNPRTGLGNLYQYVDGDWCALLDLLEDLPDLEDGGYLENDDMVYNCEEQANGEEPT